MITVIGFRERGPRVAVFAVTASGPARLQGANLSHKDKNRHTAQSVKSDNTDRDASKEQKEQQHRRQRFICDSFLQRKSHLQTAQSSANS